MDKTGDDRELRDRLPQRVWHGTSYKVEEVGGIDFKPELSRRVSHAGSLGRVSPNPNTRLRSRNGSKSSTSDAISTTNVVPSDDVTSTSDVINNEIISNSNVISANTSSRQPREAEASEMAIM
ncbi:Hypothetical predicted protein [Paramuricea clavata]|uniref:Uncharacterized protein n=1 Tax=Paramuricea clavata TaxID=317549 RepID=A0A7D9DTI8_PARCT|nr:Hypothetical predicted protein [Paramuricea clavata]